MCSPNSSNDSEHSEEWNSRPWTVWRWVGGSNLLRGTSSHTSHYFCYSIFQWAHRYVVLTTLAFRKGAKYFQWDSLKGLTCQQGMCDIGNVSILQHRIGREQSTNNSIAWNKKSTFHTFVNRKMFCFVYHCKGAGEINLFTVSHFHMHFKL